MSALYPGAAPSFTPKVDGVDYPQAVDINGLQDEVVAIGTALVSGGLAHALVPDATASARGLGSTAKGWGLAYLKGLTLGAATELTIAAGIVTATPGVFSVDTESNAASDDLDTITAGAGVAENSILILRAENVARVVTVKDGTGNLLLAGDYALSATDRVLTLIYDGTNWREVARAGTATPGITGTASAVQQIAFAATQSPSSDANTLDDYEENSWTPVLGGAGGTSGQTYSVQIGKYIKVGKMVTAWGRIVFTAKGTITGAAQLQGLPFTAENTAGLYAPLTIGYWANLGAAWIWIAGHLAPNTTVVALTGTAGAGTSVAALSTTDIANTTEMTFSITYAATA